MSDPFGRFSVPIEAPLAKPDPIATRLHTLLSAAGMCKGLSGWSNSELDYSHVSEEEVQQYILDLMEMSPRAARFYASGTYLFFGVILTVVSITALSSWIFDPRDRAIRITQFEDRLLKLAWRWETHKRKKAIEEALNP